MINLKEYIVTLMAMFLSLAIGIMVGTSITESVVVEQQKNIIEQLESRYFNALTEMEELTGKKETQESLLTLYDVAAKQLVLMDDWKSLVGHEVALLSLDTQRGMEVAGFLKENGLKVNPHIFADGTGSFLEEEVNKNALREVFTMAHHLLEGDLSAGIPQTSYVGLEYQLPFKPEAILLVLGGTSFDAGQARLLQEYIKDFPKEKVILLEDFFIKESLLDILSERDIRCIDYIDTATGKIALLALLRGNQGLSALKPLIKGLPK